MSLSHEIALRIGLAARELPDTDAARLLRVLDAAIGLPPTEEKLATLTVKELKAAAEGEFAHMDSAVLKSALAYLKGEMGIETEPLPAVEPYQDGEMPGSLRVAVASNSGELLDGHFGSCKRFLIYQVSSGENRLIDIRDTAGGGEDKNSHRAALIQDCQLVLVASIGGPAAAKVVRAGIHPIKKPHSGPARAEIQALQAVVDKGAPPWLAKVMGQTPEERIRALSLSKDAEEQEAA